MSHGQAYATFDGRIGECSAAGCFLAHRQPGGAHRDPAALAGGRGHGAEADRKTDPGHPLQPAPLRAERLRDDALGETRLDGDCGVRADRVRPRLLGLGHRDRHGRRRLQRPGQPGPTGAHRGAPLRREDGLPSGEDHHAQARGAGAVRLRRAPGPGRGVARCDEGARGRPSARGRGQKAGHAVARARRGRDGAQPAPEPEPEPEPLPSEAARQRLDSAYIEVEAAKKALLDALMDEGETLAAAFAQVEEACIPSPE